MKSGIFERITGYLNALQVLVMEHHQKHYPNLQVPRIYLEHGRKYVRVAEYNGSQNLVHSFVDLDTGNVLKAASWKKPVTTNPRSNVFDADYGMSGVTVHGAKYL